MWLSFVLVCALCVGVLYVPGFLVLISLRSLRWSDALACAPLVSVAFYAAVAIALPGLGLRASLATLVLPLAVAGALALAMGLVFRRLVPSRGHAARESVGEVGFEIRLLALTLAMGVLVTGFYFVRNLDGPASVFQAFDNGTGGFQRSLHHDERGVVQWDAGTMARRQGGGSSTWGGAA